MQDPDYQLFGTSVENELELTLTKARQMCIHEIYMCVNKDNPASLRVQIKNGAYIHHENDKKYFTRINEIEKEEVNKATDEAIGVAQN